ncbi:MAG: hypothetical protein ABW352_22610 [Polyangiales bacterium]
MPATMMQECLHGVLLEVHNQFPPSDEEWERLLALVSASLEKAASCLVFSRGPGPSATQRKRLAAMLTGRKYPTAVLTDSIVARGAVTALSWVGHSIRAFATNDVLRAMDMLPVSVAHRRDVLVRLVQMMHELEGKEAPAKLVDFDLPALARFVSDRSLGVRS